MVQVLTRCLNILEVLPEKEGGFGVLELSRKVGLPGSTVHRILNALKKEGYISQDPDTEKYQLGYKILNLAGKMTGSRDLKRLAVPYLRKLRDKTGETAHFILMEGENAVCVESVESFNNMRACSPVGENNPLHCTAVGKAILANLPEEEQKRVLSKGLKKYTAGTISSRKELKKELDAVKRCGYALDREEYQPGIRCVAAPVKNSQGRVIAAVGISSPSFRITGKKEAEFIKELKETACRLSRECGNI